ncbi:hypothetical protein BBJ28_00022428 [Nothophytophthora sp. Chile5]|nr:hypothetical protein BBJ28_00022428 [Nothophytophthora sp. Chile5]
MPATGIPPYIEMYRQVEGIRKAVDLLPTLLAETVTSAISNTNGPSGIMTKDAIKDTLREVLSEAGLGNASETEVTPVAATTPEVHAPLYVWGGGIHRLPNAFEFPSVDALGAWKLCFFGNKALQVPPYATIKTVDLSTRTKRNRFSEWSRFVVKMKKGIEDSTKKPMPPIQSEKRAEALFKCYG